MELAPPIVPPIVTEEQLSVNCPLYKTKDEFLCDCAWHSQYLGYNHAIKVIFATDRPVAVQRLLEKRPPLKALYLQYQEAVALHSGAVLRLQEELVAGTSDVWQVSTILTEETKKLDAASAQFRELKDRLVADANRLLEVYYNVKL
jgi:hypothetical protein